MDLSHLRDFRQKAVLSQEQLAQKSGVARDTISKLESGHRQAYPATVRKLASGLDVEPRMLAGGVRYLDDGNAKDATEDTGPEEAKKSSEEEPRKKMGF